METVLGGSLTGHLLPVDNKLARARKAASSSWLEHSRNRDYTSRRVRAFPRSFLASSIWRRHHGFADTCPCGLSGLHITTVGFGSWAVGGGGWSFGWGPQDDAESIATMHHALELGINWIDTAAVYGLGHSEEVVGKLLRELPASQHPLIFTKCGLTWDANNPMEMAKRILKPESIQRECEDSLRRLGVERIDLYQFHWPDEMGTPVEDSWGEMVKLIGSRKSGAPPGYRISMWNCSGGAKPFASVDSLQPLFSMVSRWRRGRCASVVQRSAALA